MKITSPGRSLITSARPIYAVWPVFPHTPRYIWGELTFTSGFCKAAAPHRTLHATPSSTSQCHLSRSLDPSIPRLRRRPCLRELCRSGTEGDSFRSLSCGRACTHRLTSRCFAPVLLRLQEAGVQLPRFRNSRELQHHSAG